MVLHDQFGNIKILNRRGAVPGKLILLYGN